MSQQQEINEAIHAIDNSLSLLEESLDYLNSASSWGIIDILGGGFFTSLVKRSKIYDAKKTLEMAKESLLHVKDELEDIEKFKSLSIDISDFLGFADYFFDGLILDWMVQSKIGKAKTQVQEAISQLKNLKKQLNRLLE